MANTRFAYTNRLDNAATIILNGAAVVTGVINQWTNGSTSVTRASGSYVTDGVKRWSLISGNLATRFPANTRVTNVTALTLTVSAAATAGGSGTDSATFTPDQPLNELAAYPMSNAINGQRYIPWFSASSPGSPVIIEFDLGSSLACTIAAALNAGPFTGGGLISSVEVEWASAISGASPTWNAIDNWAPASAVDSGADFASQSARFWRFKILNTGQFAIGRLWLGVLQSDMGGLFSPGTVKGKDKNRRRERNPAGVQHSFYNGRVLRHWDFLYTHATDAQRALIEGVFNQQTTALLIDDSDIFAEVESDDAFDWSVVFINLQDFRLRFQELF